MRVGTFHVVFFLFPMLGFIGLHFSTNLEMFKPFIFFFSLFGCLFAFSVTLSFLSFGDSNYKCIKSPELIPLLWCLDDLLILLKYFFLFCVSFRIMSIAMPFNSLIFSAIYYLLLIPSSSFFTLNIVALILFLEAQFMSLLYLLCLYLTCSIGPPSFWTCRMQLWWLFSISLSANFSIYISSASFLSDCFYLYFGLCFPWHEW